MGLFEEFRKIGIVPVVVIDDAEQAVGLAEALIKGGLPCAEVTFRTAAAEEAIRRITEAFPEMLVGAGTVLTTERPFYRRSGPESGDCAVLPGKKRAGYPGCCYAV